VEPFLPDTVLYVDVGWNFIVFFWGLIDLSLFVKVHVETGS